MTLGRAIEPRIALLDWDLAELARRAEIPLADLEGFIRYDPSLYCSQDHLWKICGALWKAFVAKKLHISPAEGRKRSGRGRFELTSYAHILKDLYSATGQLMGGGLMLDQLLADRDRRFLIGWTPNIFMEKGGDGVPRGIGVEWVRAIAAFMGLELEWRYFPTEKALQEALVAWNICMSGVMIQWPVIMPSLRLHRIPNIFVEYDRFGEVCRSPVCIACPEKEVRMSGVISDTIEILRLNCKFPDQRVIIPL